MLIEEELELLGLTGIRSKIYLSMLQIGRGTIQDIAVKVGLARTTVHETVHHLLEMGLMSCSAQAKGKVYVVEPPHKLLSIQRERERKVRALLPELDLLYNATGTKPKVRFYEGAEGIKSVFENTLTVSGKVLYGILSMEDLYDVPGKVFMDHYVERRIAAGIKLNVIRTAAKEVEQNWPSSRAENREVRYNPVYMVFPMTIYLYDNKVALIGTKKEHFGMIIESADFYQTMKNFFDMLWDLSRQVKRVD